MQDLRVCLRDESVPHRTKSRKHEGTSEVKRPQPRCRPPSTATQNRAKILDRFKNDPQDGVILLKGGEQKFRYDTDVELVFRQESNFFVCWASVTALGCVGLAALCLPGVLLPSRSSFTLEWMRPAVSRLCSRER